MQSFCFLMNTKAIKKSFLTNHHKLTVHNVIKFEFHLGLFYMVKCVCVFGMLPNDGKKNVYFFFMQVSKFAFSIEPSI